MAETVCLHLSGWAWQKNMQNNQNNSSTPVSSVRQTSLWYVTLGQWSPAHRDLEPSSSAHGTHSLKNPCNKNIPALMALEMQRRLGNLLTGSMRTSPLVGELQDARDCRALPAPPTAEAPLPPFPGSPQNSSGVLQSIRCKASSRVAAPFSEP